MDDNIIVYKRRRNTRKSRRRNTRKSKRRNTRKSRRRNTRKSRRRNTRKSRRRNTRKSRRRNTRKSRRRNTYKKNNKGKSTPPSAAVAAGETPPPPVGIGGLPGKSDFDTIPGDEFDGDILRFFGEASERGIVIPKEIYIDFDDTLVPWEKMKDGVVKELDIPIGALIENETRKTLACRMDGFEGVKGFEGQFEIKKVPVEADVLAEEIKEKNSHLVNFVRECLDQRKQVNIVSFNDHNLDQLGELMVHLFKVEGEPESVSKGRADRIEIVNKNTFTRYCGIDAPSSSHFKKRAHISLALLLRDGEIFDHGDDPRIKNSNYKNILQGANGMDMKYKLLIEDSVDNVSKHQGPCILFETRLPFRVKYLPKGGDWTESDMSASGASGGDSGGRIRGVSPVGGGNLLDFGSPSGDSDGSEFGDLENSPVVRDTGASGGDSGGRIRAMDVSASRGGVSPVGGGNLDFGSPGVSSSGGSIRSFGEVSGGSEVMGKKSRRKILTSPPGSSERSGGSGGSSTPLSASPAFATVGSSGGAGGSSTPLSASPPVGMRL